MCVVCNPLAQKGKYRYVRIPFMEGDSGEGGDGVARGIHYLACPYTLLGKPDFESMQILYIITKQSYSFKELTLKTSERNTMNEVKRPRSGQHKRRERSRARAAVRRAPSGTDPMPESCQNHFTSAFASHCRGQSERDCAKWLPGPATPTSPRRLSDMLVPRCTPDPLNQRLGWSPGIPTQLSFANEPPTSLIPKEPRNGKKKYRRDGS